MKPLQMRAVSSPSLSENPLEITRNNTTKITTAKNNESIIIENECIDVSSNEDNNHNYNNINNNNNVSVYGKFKKTLSQFKGGKPTSNTQITTDLSNDTTKHRFGPLVWRSSKDRRKTKHQRRDKCNSGDSGIQLENDEQINGDNSDCLIETTNSQQQQQQPQQQNNSRVRRTNSAKIIAEGGGIITTTKNINTEIGLNKSGSSSSPTTSLKNEENIIMLKNTGRSLSQPSGLERIVKIRAADDSDTESVSSQQDLNNEMIPIYAEVLYTFEPAGQQELRLEKGALIQVIRREPGPWWFGQLKHDAVLSNIAEFDKIEGWFPKEFIRIIPPFPQPKNTIIHNNEDVDGNHDHHYHHHLHQQNDENNVNEAKNCDIKIAQNINNLPSSSSSTSSATTKLPTTTTTASTSQQNSKLIKENVIKELLETEINYVKLLSALCIGFLKELKQRSDIFSTESVNIIFSNIEKIWRFQQSFLEALRKAIDNQRIAECFLEYQSAFMIYSTYCNCYPRALLELEQLATNKEATNILEECRIKQNLPELPLSAHLLAPIQRICRYPLHLIELVKHSLSRQETIKQINIIEQNTKLATSPTTTTNELNKKIDIVEIPTTTTAITLGTTTIDCKEIFETALSAMKHVTEMVNEGKRHSEYLSRIQSRFDNFQGPPINIHSTRLFLQTDAIRMSPNLWNNTYTLFLFDHQLIYCKKDILKRTNYLYKGRIYLNNCRILNLPDGKIFGVTLKNALRIYCDNRNKWLDFCFRSINSKLRFMNILKTERQYCGENLFISELSGNNLINNDDNNDDNDDIDNDDDDDKLIIIDNDDNLDDMCYNNDDCLINERGIDTIINYTNINKTNQKKKKLLNDKINLIETKNGGNIKIQQKQQQQQKYNSETLPKKTNKTKKEQQSSSGMMNYEFNTSSLGRRKIGNWFRKAKSTNNTPSQSPTHQQQQQIQQQNINSLIVNSESSSQSSSPTNYRVINNNKIKIKDCIVNNT